VRVKRCTDCHHELPISNFSKDLSKKIGYKTKCKGCVSRLDKKYKQTEQYERTKNKYRETLKRKKQADPLTHWVQRAYFNAKTRAKKNRYEFTITKSWLRENIAATCPLLGITLIYNSTKTMDASASLDRKDSTKGYTPENCRIISFRANRIKNNATTEELQMLASSLDNY